MTQHHWRTQVKSFFESHVDQDKHEQLKETRKDMEDKKEKIMHLINGEEQDGSNGKSESLEELVKDYHKEYESLYELYHNLTGELKKKIHRRKEEDKEKFSSSSSDSDSEEKGSKNGDFQNELKVEAARWDEERLQLMSENDELKVKLESSTNSEIELNQRIEELTREKNIFLEEKDSAIKCAEDAEANVVELKDNVEMLSAQKSELEDQLMKKSGEASEQMKEVFDQLNSFQKELMTLATLKAEMESELERKSQEVSESLTQIEKLTEKLANTEADQKKVLEERTSLAYLAQSLESEVESLNGEKSQLGDEIRVIRTENADLSRKNESNDQLIIELQTTIEDLKREMEMDKDELMTIEEKNRNLEVMLRLSNQKLRVTEQLLREKEEKNVALSQTLESYSDMIQQISEQANESLAALECEVTKKFGEDYGGLANSVFSLSEEVRNVKSWVIKTRLENEERIERMEMEAKKVMRMVGQLEKDVKEKEERLLGLGEEKREAIKSLCVWIEYYRSRCVELGGILVKVAPKVQRTS